MQSDIASQMLLPGQNQSIGAGEPVQGVLAVSWSKKHDKCRKCGTAERKHYSRGLCTLCYFRARNERRIAERTRHIEIFAKPPAEPRPMPDLTSFGERWWIGLLSEDAQESYARHKDKTNGR